MVSVKPFLVKVEEIAAEEPSYRKGGTGTDGTCDCIGLIIGAIRRAGGTWSGSKGSNYAARNEMKYLEPFTTASQLKVGEAVFKAYDPGDEGYDYETINNRYASSPDQHDYYHIGVVMSVNPLRIRHMTTPKPLMDTKIGKWKYHGWLKKVSEGEEVRMKATVYVEGGGTVNLRKNPSTAAALIKRIPVGTEVEVLGQGKEWCLISDGKDDGYMMTRFLSTDEAVTPAPAPETITVKRAELEKIYSQIGVMLGVKA